MYLIIDTNESRFALAGKEALPESFEWYLVKTDQSLPRMVQQAYTGEPQGIFLLQGKGGFSQTREGIVFANLYSALKGVELREIEEGDLTHPLSTWLLKPVVHSLKAEYYTEPNIS